MTTEIEKWRSEFEKEFMVIHKPYPYPENHLWDGYLHGRKAGQEKLDSQLDVITARNNKIHQLKKELEEFKSGIAYQHMHSEITNLKSLLKQAVPWVKDHRDGRPGMVVTDSNKIYQWQKEVSEVIDG